MKQLRLDDLLYSLTVITGLIILLLDGMALYPGPSYVLKFIALGMLSSAILVGRRSRKIWMQRQQAKLQELQNAMDHYDSLSNQVLGENGAQFGQLRDLLLHAADVMNDAVRRLSVSLGGLKENSLTQRDRLQELVNDLLNIASDSPDNNAGLTRFTRETEAMVREFIRTIHEMKGASEKVGQKFSHVQTQIDSVSGLLDDVNSITSQTELLALNAAIEAARAGEAGRGFAVVADEVRNLSRRTHEFSSQIRERIGEIEKSINEVDRSLEAAASTDMSVAIEAQENLHTMWEQVQQLNQKASAQSQEISQLSETIHRLIMEGVISLQFEDLVNQILAQVKSGTVELEGYFNGFIDIHRDADVRSGVERFIERARQLETLIEQHRHARQQLKSKAIGGLDENRNDVDMFHAPAPSNQASGHHDKVELF